MRPSDPKLPAWAQQRGKSEDEGRGRPAMRDYDSNNEIQSSSLNPNFSWH
jgi:hypothetical protein